MDFIFFSTIIITESIKILIEIIVLPERFDGC